MKGTKWRGGERVKRGVRWAEAVSSSGRTHFYFFAATHCSGRMEGRWKGDGRGQVDLEGNGQMEVEYPTVQIPARIVGVVDGRVWRREMFAALWTSPIHVSPHLVPQGRNVMGHLLERICSCWARIVMIAYDTTERHENYSW
jgi:hypothetical protein